MKSVFMASQFLCKLPGENVSLVNLEANFEAFTFQASGIERLVFIFH